MPVFTEFQAAVHKVVQLVPKGRVITYGDVAMAVGVPGASRAVGGVMRSNPDTHATPCHRVVKSDGTVGWYAGGRTRAGEKIARLRAEGVPVRPDGRIENFETVRWAPFQPA